MLKGKKIKLRTLLPTDLEFLQKIENDKSLWEYGSDRNIFTKACFAEQLILQRLITKVF